MKPKYLLNPLICLVIIIFLMGIFLLVGRVWAFDAQFPGMVKEPSLSAKQAAPVAAYEISQLKSIGLPSSQVFSPSPYCDGADPQAGLFPFTDSGTTVGGVDNHDLGASGFCSGGGPQSTLTGLGEDVVYKITTDSTCTLAVSMDPTGSDDLALYVESEDCHFLASNCVIVDDEGGVGVQEDVQFQATAGTPYYIIVDGYDGDSGPYDLSISEVTSTGCRLVGPNWHDLGDAPDSSNHFGVNMTAYPSGVTAHFPTVFDATTGSPPGPRHWHTDVAWFGLGITNEFDADWQIDGDGRTNINPVLQRADLDDADDGLVFPVDFPDCELTTITYTVTVGPGESAVPRYVNMWVDFNRDGDWEDTTTGCLLDMKEWAVIDDVFTLGTGTYTLTTPWIYSENKTPEDPLWMRITLSDQPAPNDGYGSGPLDGYLFGETEDYYLCYINGSYYQCNSVYLPFMQKD